MPETSLVAACRNHFADPEMAVIRVKALISNLHGVTTRKIARRAKNVQSAAETVYACLLARNTITKDDHRLKDAQSSCMWETKQSALKNELAWVQASAYVLMAEIAALRFESETASAHIANAFRTAPQWARLEFSDIFTYAFKPKLYELYNALATQRAKIALTNYSARIMAMRVGAVAWVPIAGALSMGMTTLTGGRSAGGAGQIMAHAFRDAKKLWQDATQENYRKQDTLVIEQKFEKKLNVFCKNLAIEFL